MCSLLRNKNECKRHEVFKQIIPQPHFLRIRLSVRKKFHASIWFVQNTLAIFFFGSFPAEMHSESIILRDDFDSYQMQGLNPMMW